MTAYFPHPDRVTLRELIAARIFDYEPEDENAEYQRPSEADAHEIADRIVALLDEEDLLKPLPEVSE